MKLKSIKLYSFIIFTFLSFVLSLNYFFQKSYNNIEFPFGLSGNYLEYSLENSARPVLSQDFKEFLLDQEIVLISLYDNEDTAGFFDSFYYYNQYFKFTNSSGRYMSRRDYEDENDISFLSRSNDSAGTINEDPLYLVFPGNPLYKDTIKEYKNLFALEVLGDKLIIDSSHKGVLNEIDGQLKDLGYEKIDSPKPSFLETLTKYRENRSFLVFILSALIYVFYLIGFVSYIFSEKELMYLYWTSNPNGKSFINNFYKSLILRLFISTLICYISYSIIGYYFRLSHFAFYLSALLNLLIHSTIIYLALRLILKDFEKGKLS